MILGSKLEDLLIGRTELDVQANIHFHEKKKARVKFRACCLHEASREMKASGASALIYSRCLLELQKARMFHSSNCLAEMEMSMVPRIQRKRNRGKMESQTN